MGGFSFGSAEEVTYVEHRFGEAKGAAIVDRSGPLAVLFAIPIMMFIGIVMERGLIKHFHKRPNPDRIPVTFGLAIVRQEIIKYSHGANPIPIPGPPAFTGSFDFGAMLGFAP